MRSSNTCVCIHTSTWLICDNWLIIHGTSKYYNASLPSHHLGQGIAAKIKKAIWFWLASYFRINNSLTTHKPIQEFSIIPYHVFVDLDLSYAIFIHLLGKDYWNQLISAIKKMTLNYKLTVAKLSTPPCSKYWWTRIEKKTAGPLVSFTASLVWNLFCVELLLYTLLQICNMSNVLYHLEISPKGTDSSILIMPRFFLQFYFPNIWKIGNLYSWNFKIDFYP